MQNSDYQAVSCQLHSDLELAIMHRQYLQITLKSGVLNLYPKDILTRRGEGEFLMARDDSDQTIEIRLDKIKHWQVIT